MKVVIMKFSALSWAQWTLRGL